MHHFSDTYFLKVHHIEKLEKMRQAKDIRELKNAGLNPYLLDLSRIRQSVRSFLLRLSLFEKPANPCLDCPPAGA